MSFTLWCEAFAGGSIFLSLMAFVVGLPSDRKEIREHEAGTADQMTLVVYGFFRRNVSVLAWLLASVFLAFFYVLINHEHFSILVFFVLYMLISLRFLYYYYGFIRRGLSVWSGHFGKYVISYASLLLGCMTVSALDLLFLLVR